MRIRNNQAGFSIIELVIVVVILGLIGFVGYTTYHRIQTKKSASNTSVPNESPTASDVTSAPQIDTTSDLDHAIATLNQTDPSSSSDSANLDTQLANF